MPNFLFNSMDSRFKNPVGACDLNCDITFIIRINLNVKFCEFQHNKIDSNFVNSIPMTHIGNEGNIQVFKIIFKPQETGVFFYRFRIFDYDGNVFYLNRGASQQGVLEREPKVMFQQTIYDKNLETPTQFRGGIMYQIFPDRFFKGSKEATNIPKDRIMRSDWGGVPFYSTNKTRLEDFIGNDYFGGNLKGIEEKLDYLKSLNVSIIYLNPIFESHSNHRYNTANYFKIDPVLGSEEDFINLCKKAHNLGIKIILDGVFSHVGEDSIYFNKNGRYENLGAFQSSESPYYSWFSFDNSSVGYKSWWGIASLPETNENDPSFTEFICGEKGVLAHWLSLGADGFRLDVADELPDEFLEKVRDRIKLENKNALLIGEVWEDATVKYSHGCRRKYLLGNQLDGVMNYPFKNAILDFLTNKSSEIFKENILNILNNYPADSLENCMNFISTHDTIRAINVLSGSKVCELDRETQSSSFLSEEEIKHATNLLKCAFCMLFTLCGIPCIYYGDEVGVTGWADPFNRACFPWGNENTDLLRFVKELTGIHTKENDIFKLGKLKFIHAGNNIVAYKRYLNNRQVVVVVNMSENAVLVKDFCDNVLLSTQNTDNGYLPSNCAMIGLIE